MIIRRGDIYWAKLPEQKGSNLIQKNRPVIVVSNDTANRFSPIVCIVPITGQCKKILPTHVRISGFGLLDTSTALTEQVMSVDKTILYNKIGTLVDTDEMQKIAQCLCIQLGVA